MGGIGKTGTRVAIGVLTFLMVGIAGGLLWTTLVVGESGSGCASPQAREGGPQGPPPGVNTPTEEELIGWRTAVAAQDATAAFWTPEIITPVGGAARGGEPHPHNPDGSPDVTGLTPVEGWIDVQPPEPVGSVGGQASLPDVVNDPC